MPPKNWAANAKPCKWDKILKERKNNPDGSELYLQTVQSNRSTIRPFDNDGDGLLDEDSGEDIGVSAKPAGFRGGVVRHFRRCSPSVPQGQ